MSILNEKTYLGVCRLKMASTQNIASATETELNFNTLASLGYDPFVMGDLANHSITVREPGAYFINVAVHWDGEVTPVSYTYRYIRLWVNGVAAAGVNVPTTVAANDLTLDTIVQSTAILDLNAGDVIEARAAQGSGETLTVLTAYSNFTVFRLPVNHK